MDRLSNLPEDVLDKILCFFPQKQAVRTCLLSRSWRYRGSTRSKLELCKYRDFDDDGNPEKFVSVLDHSLQRYHIDQNLCLKQLILKLGAAYTSLHCVLTSIALKAEFLVELCLEECDFRRIDSTYNNFSLKNLRKLSVVGGYGYFHNGAYFPRLKYLNIQRTLLMSADSFAFFASNYMPSLEDFHLSDCDGLKEFHLSNPSIKYLHITTGMTELTKATIDVPNLVSFKLFVPVLSPTPFIYFVPISSEWESNIHLEFSQYTYNKAVNKLLKALSQSRITLQFVDHYLDFTKGPIASICPNKPLIVVEHFHLSGFYSYSEVHDLFNSWFRSFRPRHIYDVYNKDMRVFEIIWKTLLNGIKSSWWHQDLVEVIVETSYGRSKEWHPFHGKSFSKPALASNQRVHLRLKWRD